MYFLQLETIKFVSSEKWRGNDIIYGIFIPTTEHRYHIHGMINI